MTLTLFPLAAIVIGLVLWFLPLPPKVQEIGKILFFVGIFWFVGSHASTGQVVIR